MKAQADFRMTMILEQQGALRRAALRARMATNPWDVLATDGRDAGHPLDSTHPATLAARGAGARAHRAADVPRTAHAAHAAAPAKAGSGECCGEGAVAA